MSKTCEHGFRGFWITRAGYLDERCVECGKVFWQSSEPRPDMITFPADPDPKILSALIERGRVEP